VDFEKKYPSLYLLLLEYDRLTIYMSDTDRDKIKSMIERMLREMTEQPIKLNRWLGFIQGVLYTHGLRTVKALMAETRGDAHKELATAARGRLHLFAGPEDFD
jgi:hypothetical protein